MPGIQQVITLKSSSVVLDAGNGGTVFQVDGASPFDSTVGIRFNTDGTVETGKSLNGAAITWSSAGTWIDPLASASGNYSVRYTNRVSTGGHDFTVKAAVEDTWIALGSQRVWTWNETNTLAAPDNDFDCDFEVRDDVGGAMTGTSAYTFHIENTT